MARALWKGRLVLGKEELPVRLYTAAEDRTVHFRLLDSESREKVHQRIVRKNDGEAVPKAEQRKAVLLEDGRAVLLSAADIENLEPAASRDIGLARFVPRSALTEQWYEKPYWLGPEKQEAAYFALAKVLADGDLVGIARWVMRRRRHVGALTVVDGYLMLVTLRRTEQVLALPDLKPPREPDRKELALAERLVDAAAGKFDPSAWQDEYHERVCALIEAKAKGKVVRMKSRRPRAATGSLAAQLKKSLAGARVRKVA